MPLRRRHEMPFGAAVLDGGGVRFRLWAPAAERVEVLLEGRWAERTLPMKRLEDGWFATDTDAATVGSLYRFRIDDKQPAVPDPASRHQPRDVHGPSQVADPQAFLWQDDDWRGRPWEETIIYELHVGAFSPQGTFGGVEQNLDHLAELGVTAIELMPVADFPGRRNWGYDGVLPFAPDTRYGTPEDLKLLVQAAHRRGLMVFLDVVYNHFGPEGNYLHLYAPHFFTERHHTPWGAAINYDGDDAHWVRQYVIHNALYWLEEFHFDGLRLDAVHAIFDDSRPDIIEAIAAAVAEGPARERHVHLVLENDNNAAHYLRGPRGFRAQWNDDIHHALHVLITGEISGYYEDYAGRPAAHLGRCLAAGFAYQGENSPHRGGTPRGEPTAGLPPTAFVSFLENHDQIGNRAFGERTSVLAAPDARIAALSTLLLAPAPPLLFMGQEWGSTQPFPFFCDFGDDLADAVTEGRRREFARFPEFSDPATREQIPDPMSPQTFEQAVLRWEDAGTAEGRRWLDFTRQLLSLRKTAIVPRLAEPLRATSYESVGPRGLLVWWQFGNGDRLALLANYGADPLSVETVPPGRILFAWPAGSDRGGIQVLAPWSVIWFLTASGGPDG